MPGLGPPIRIYNTNWDCSSLVPGLPLAAWQELQCTPSLAAACIGCLELWESLYHEPMVAATFVIFADIWKSLQEKPRDDLHGVCGPLSEFAAETNKGNSVEEPPGEAGLDESVGWSRVSRWTVLARLIESTELAPSCTGLAVGRALKKGTMTPTSTSVQGESCPAPIPPAFHLKLVN